MRVIMPVMKNAKISKVRAAPKAANPAPSARKKTAAPPKYKILEFAPFPKTPRRGINLATELMRIGRSVGGVNLKLPPRP